MIEPVAGEIILKKSAGKASADKEGFLWQILANNKAKAGIVIFLVFAFIGIIGPFISPYSPYTTKFPDWLPPSSAHLFGTDYIGHDLLSWYLYGTGTSLYVGASVAIIATLIGTAVGLIAGYYAGITDNVLMRVVDIFLILPTFPLLVILSAYLPPKTSTTILILSFLSWPFMSRVIRSQILTLKEQPFIDAARLAGLSGFRIMFGELFKHVLPLIIINAVYLMVGAIVAQAGLAFFGLGNLNSINWGTSLYWAQTEDAIVYRAWWWIVPPGLSIALVGIAANLFGSGVNEAMGKASGEVK
ncbi:MAG: ABC transporter permease [Thermoplasmataceae archaeon]|jgi:peptide/nickel transport system permease protein